MAMILLSSGNQLLCFAEIKHLQRLLTAINGKLLLLPICQLERYVALKVALVHSCLRQYLSKKRYTHTFQTCFLLHIEVLNNQVYACKAV